VTSRASRLCASLSLASLGLAGLVVPAARADAPRVDAPGVDAPGVEARRAARPAAGTTGRLTAWAPCGQGLQCAALPVPLDYAHPGLGTIDLAVVRRPASDAARRIGALVYLEGGPGVSGIDSIRAYPELFDQPVRDRFDIVGFDQRGVGASAPVRCLTDQQKAVELASAVVPHREGGGGAGAGAGAGRSGPAPSRPPGPPAVAAGGGAGAAGAGAGAGGAGAGAGAGAGGSQSVAASGRSAEVLAGFDGTAASDRLVAQGCERWSAALLPYLSTEFAARDLDVLRGALGGGRLTAYGASYGTELGATYAQLFPTRLRALVLDAVVDPAVSTTDPFAETRLQALGFEAAFDAFLASCAADPNCGFGHGDPAGAYDRLIARLAAHPIHVQGKDADRTRVVDDSAAVTAVLQLLYSEEQWPILAVALQLADDDNDGAVLQALADQSSGRRPDGTYDNSFDANTAINCADQAYPTDLAAFRRFARDLSVEAPRFGASLALSGMTCAFWPVRAAERYTGPFRAQGSPPILLVGTTGDPATPYAEARSLAGQLDNAVLLTWKSYTHGAYVGPSGCVHDAVDRYLIDLVTPRPGTVCS